MRVGESTLKQLIELERQNSRLISKRPDDKSAGGRAHFVNLVAPLNMLIMKAWFQVLTIMIVLPKSLQAGGW